MSKSIYNNLAIEYAEQYGIISYKIDKNTMVYYKSYPAERVTYKCIVDLERNTEERKSLKRYYKPYKVIGKIQVLRG